MRVTRRPASELPQNQPCLSDRPKRCSHRSCLETRFPQSQSPFADGSRVDTMGSPLTLFGNRVSNCAVFRRLVPRPSD